ncbi:MAG TPA: hypothetical protein VHE12_07910 [bacterium]|nr:hypothetical protein [bacterium]
MLLVFLTAPAFATPPRGVSGDLWADRILGQPDFTETKFNETNARNLYNPTSVHVDIAHNTLYLWDSGNNRLLAVHNLSSAGNDQGADMVLGQPDFNHSSCNGDSFWQDFLWSNSPNGFHSPPVLPNASCFCGQGYMLQSPAEAWSTANMDNDAAGNLYVPDYINNRILRFDYPLSTHQTASHVWGQLDGSGNERFDYQAYDNGGANNPSTPTNQNLGFFPTIYGDEGGLPQYGAGVALDRWGNLWVADSQNQRVLRFPNVSGLPSHTADVVLGQANFNSNGTNTNVNNLTSLPILNDPLALRVDYSGNVYVVESNNYYGRLTIFQPTGTDGSGVPVYANHGATQKIVVSGSTGPMGIEIDPAMNNTSQVGLWVIDHLQFKMFRYQVTWPAFSYTTTRTINTPECLASPGIDGVGNLYISNYRGMGVLRYPAGSNNYDLSIFQQPTGANNTQNKIGDVGFYVPDGVLVAPLPAAGVTQLIAADGIRLHFWNMPNGDPTALSNGQPEDGYAGTSQPYVFNSSYSAGFGELALDANGTALWTLNATNPTRVEAYSLPLPLPGAAETSPVRTLASPLPVLGKTVTVPWTSLAGLTADEAGNLWIADSPHSRVMRIRDPWGQTLGCNGQPGPCVDVILGQPDPGSGPIPANCNGVATSSPCNGSPSASTLNFPGQLAMDHHGDLFVSDHMLEFFGNLRLLRYDAKSIPANNPSCVFAIPADGVYGTGGSFTTYGSTLYDKSFWKPAFKSDDSVMVVGTNSQASGGYPPVIIQNPLNGVRPAGTPDIPGAGDNPVGHLNDYGPQSFASVFDDQDNLYVTELNRNRVLIYQHPFGTPGPTSTPTSSFTPTPTGTSTHTPTPTATSTSTFTGTLPTDTPSFSPTPTLTPTSTASPTPSWTPTPTSTWTSTFTSTASPTPTGSWTPTPTNSPVLACGTIVWTQTPNSLSVARGIAIDYGRGLGYVADNNSVRKFDLTTGALTGTVGAGNQFGSPQGINLGGDGNLYVANYSTGNLQKVDPVSGTVLATIGSTDGLGTVRDVFVDGNGDLYLTATASTNSLVRYVYGAPATCGGIPTYTKVILTLGGTALNTPTGIAKVGPRLFVADSLHNRVVMYRESTTGSNNYDQATVLTGNSVALNTPQELTTDLAGNIYVADYANQAFVVWGPDGTFQSNYQKSGFGSPFGVGVDASGNVYLADASSVNRVVKVFGGCLSEPAYGTSTPTASCTPTSTRTATPSPTPTSTYSPTASPTDTWTGTSTPTDTSTSTWTFTASATDSPTDTPTDTSTWTFTNTSTWTPTDTPTDTSTHVFTATPTDSATDTWTDTATSSPTGTFTFTPTVTFTSTATPTFTDTWTATFTPTPSFTQTPTPSYTPTGTFTVTPTATFTVTGTFTKTATSTFTRTPTLTATRTNTGTITPTPTRTQTPTRTGTPTRTNTPTKTSTPTSGTGCGTSTANLQLMEFSSCGGNQSMEKFEVINKGTAPVTLSDISIKFWVDDVSGQGLVGAVNYGGCFGSTCTAVSGVAVHTLSFSPACGPDGTHQADWEVTLSTTDSRTLAAGVTWANIQTALHLSNWSNFANSSIWYSPCGVGGGTTYTNDLHYAVYLRGNLVTASGGIPPACRPLPTCTPNGGSMMAMVLGDQDKATSTPTAGSDRERVPFAMAAPNISRDGEEVKFLVRLEQASTIHWVLFDLSGEKVLARDIQGQAGTNSLSWVLDNQNGSPVASGLYLYAISAQEGSLIKTAKGKVVVLH